MVYLAADHAGFELKKEIRAYLKELGYEAEDVGADELVSDDDYPDYVFLAAQKVAEKPDENKAIVFGGSGQGEAVAANKVKGVRAAVYYGGSMDIIRLSREHNDANVLSLGARFVGEEEAKEAVKLWLKTGFDKTSRHQRRHEKIAAREK